MRADESARSLRQRRRLVRPRSARGRRRIEARRLDVDDHEVPCGVHSSALLPAPTRLRVLLAHRGFAHLRQGAGCRRSGCREACGGTSRFGGPVDCYQIVTGRLPYFPLPSFVTLFAFGGRGDLGEPVTNCGRTQHAAALLDRRGRRLLGHIAPLATVTSSTW